MLARRVCALLLLACGVLPTLALHAATVTVISTPGLTTATAGSTVVAAPAETVRLPARPPKRPPTRS